MNPLYRRRQSAGRTPALVASRENEPVVSTRDSVQLDPADDGHFLMTDSRQDDFTAVDQVRSLAVSALDRRKHASSRTQNAGDALLDLLKGAENAETERDASESRAQLEEAILEFPEVERMLRKVHRPRNDSAGVVVRHPNTRSPDEGKTTTSLRKGDAPPLSAGR